jgi:hypothetical protein
MRGRGWKLLLGFAGFFLAAAVGVLALFGWAISSLGDGGQTRVLHEERQTSPDGKSLAVLRYESSGGATGALYYALYVASVKPDAGETLAAVVLRSPGPSEPGAATMAWKDSRRLVLSTSGDVRKHVPEVELESGTIDVKVIPMRASAVTATRSDPFPR